MRPVLMVALMFAGTLSQAQLPAKISGIDLEKIVNNDRLLQSYLRCFLDQGPCTAQGREGKKLFPIIYETNCAECTQEQKQFTKKSVKLFISKRKSDWEKIVHKYDPERKKEKEFLLWVNQP